MTTVTSPSRVPFGLLDESRLRNLTNIKNKQNAIIPPSSALGKRRYEPDADPAFDAENVDPSIFSKKAKNGNGGFVKPASFVLKPTSTGPVLTPTTRQTITPKRLTKKAIDVKPVAFSAPAMPTAPAGRSPTRKRAGILSHRRTSGSSFTRVEPPAFNLGHGSRSGLPFSIDSALLGTVPAPTLKGKSSAPADAVMTLEDNVPSSWVFDIHEDTPDEELGNLMQHSTEVLDISDDEDRKARLLAEVGKENIAPPEYTGRQRNIASRDLMSEDARTPLGDLKPSDFYAEGCDANSYYIIDDDKLEKMAPRTQSAPELPALKSSITPTPSPVDGGSTNREELLKLFASVGSYAPISGEAEIQPILKIVSEDASSEIPTEQIDIWESESAHGEEPAQQQPITTTASLQDSLAAVSRNEEAAIEAVS